MSEPIRTLDGRPPQTLVPTGRPPRRRRRMLLGLTSLIGLLGVAFGLYISGLGSALVGANHIRYEEGWVSNGHVESHGLPEVHVFRVNSKFKPYLQLSFVNSSRWTLEIVRIRPPIEEQIGWKVFVGAWNAPPEQARPFQPLTVKPGERFEVLFKDASPSCHPAGGGTETTLTTEGIQMTYRVAGVGLDRFVPGNRVVFIC